MNANKIYNRSESFTLSVCLWSISLRRLVDVRTTIAREMTIVAAIEMHRGIKSRSGAGSFSCHRSTTPQALCDACAVYPVCVTHGLRDYCTLYVYVFFTHSMSLPTFPVTIARTGEECLPVDIPMETSNCLVSGPNPTEVDNANYTSSVVSSLHRSSFLVRAVAGFAPSSFRSS